ncbi:transposase [Belnapia sp. T18]|uniref:Transposase n=1 Tax=Belnapia arida TaxID=2804533 RepID=A0ABS1U4M9_9PROT|nr:transposase [Belnapia arida]MBL6079636.1 transposase [Belnapia arida]
MPRIPREEHATIVRRVDVEGHKVAEVAATYGCTPANIYAILAKLRRQAAEEVTPAAPPPGPVTAEADAVPMMEQATATDLFGGLPEVPPEPMPSLPLASTTPDLPPIEPERPLPTLPGEPVQPEPQPRPAASGRATRVAEAKPARPAPPPRVAKAGYALLMRTSDGEEAVNPFRSLDELLSAAKPILRTAARSPEPIWFSIQQVDLDTLGDDV